MSAIATMHGMRPNLGWSNSTSWVLRRKLWLILWASVAQYAAEDWNQMISS